MADGWCESIKTGALPESGNGVRSDDGVGKPPQNSVKSASKRLGDPNRMRLEL